MCTVKLSSMEKEFVPYPLALRLKAIEFDEPCMAVYFGNGENELFTFNPSIAKEITLRMVELGHIPCPTYSQAFTWFREECGIWVTFEYDDCDCVEADICWYVGKCFRYGIGPLFLTNELGDFKTLQEAELACLEKLIQIVESKQKEDGK